MQLNMCLSSVLNSNAFLKQDLYIQNSDWFQWESWVGKEFRLGPWSISASILLPLKAIVKFPFALMVQEQTSVSLILCVILQGTSATCELLHYALNSRWMLWKLRVFSILQFSPFICKKFLSPSAIFPVTPPGTLLVWYNFSPFKF